MRVSAPPQAPHVGVMRRILGPFHVTGVFWYRFHRLGASIPRWLIPLLLPFFTGFFFLFLFRIRGAVARNLVPVLGPCGWFQRQVRIFRTLWAFAWCLTERYEQTVPGRAVRATMEGVAEWQRLLAGERGFILLTAHLGNWEVGSALPALEWGKQVHVVREAERDPEAQRFVEQLIRDHAVPGQITHFVGRDPALGVKLLEALRAGNLVALQGDRPRTGGGVTPAMMFGLPYDLPEGPLALARAAEVPLLPVFLFREGRARYRVVIRPPVQVSREGVRAADCRRAASGLAKQIEWAIRERPHQWFCFADAWTPRSDELAGRRGQGQAG